MSAREEQSSTNRAARRIYKDTTRRVRQRAVQVHGVVSSWLKDHAGCPNKGVIIADQLARLAIEMDGAGYTRAERNRAIAQMSIAIADRATNSQLAA